MENQKDVTMVKDPKPGTVLPAIAPGVMAAVPLVADNSFPPPMPQSDPSSWLNSPFLAAPTGEELYREDASVASDDSDPRQVYQADKERILREFDKRDADGDWALEGDAEERGSQDGKVEMEAESVVDPAMREAAGASGPDMLSAEQTTQTSSLSTAERLDSSTTYARMLGQSLDEVTKGMAELQTGGSYYARSSSGSESSASKQFVKVGYLADERMLQEKVEIEEKGDGYYVKNHHWEYPLDKADSNLLREISLGEFKILTSVLISQRKSEAISEQDAVSLLTAALRSYVLLKRSKSMEVMWASVSQRPQQRVGIGSTFKVRPVGEVNTMACAKCRMAICTKDVPLVRIEQHMIFSAPHWASNAGDNLCLYTNARNSLACLNCKGFVEANVPHIDGKASTTMRGVLLVPVSQVIVPVKGGKYHLEHLNGSCEWRFVTDAGDQVSKPKEEVRVGHLGRDPAPARQMEADCLGAAEVFGKMEDRPQQEHVPERDRAHAFTWNPVMEQAERLMQEARLEQVAGASGPEHDDAQASPKKQKSEAEGSSKEPRPPREDLTKKEIAGLSQAVSLEQGFLDAAQEANDPEELEEGTKKALIPLAEWLRKFEGSSKDSSTVSSTLGKKAQELVETRRTELRQNQASSYLDFGARPTLWSAEAREVMESGFQGGANPEAMSVEAMRCAKEECLNVMDLVKRDKLNWSFYSEVPTNSDGTSLSKDGQFLKPSEIMELLLKTTKGQIRARYSRWAVRSDRLSELPREDINSVCAPYWDNSRPQTVYSGGTGASGPDMPPRDEAIPPPVWEKGAFKYSRSDFERDERMTFPVRDGHKFDYWSSFVGDFTDEEVAREREGGLRPCYEDLVSPTFAVHRPRNKGQPQGLDVEGNSHWVRTSVHCTFAQLVVELQHKYNLKQLWGYFQMLPIVSPTHSRGRAADYKAKRRLEFKGLVKEAKSWLIQQGIEPPQTPSEWQTVRRMVGRWLATKKFMTKNPNWVMDLPIVPGHDSKEIMEWRAMYDERITVPVDHLPMEVQAYFKEKYAVVELYYRCNGELWWEDTWRPGEKAQYDLDHARSGTSRAGATGPDPPVAAASAQPAALQTDTDEIWEAKTKPRHITWPIPAVMYASKGKRCWRKVECGLVLPTCTGWELKVRSKNNKGGKNAWKCNYCQQNWKGKKEGSRFMVLYDGETCLQLILDNPPTELENKHQKERMEYYKRLEPHDVVRDAHPIVPPDSASHRIRYTGAASDMIYRKVWSDHSAEGYMVMDEIAKLAAPHRAKSNLFTFGADEETRNLTGMD